MTHPALPYSKREQRGWYMYDLANSTFQSTVLTLFLGPYLTVACQSCRRPGRACSSAGYSRGSPVVVGLPDLYLRDYADLCSADRGDHRRFQPRQEAPDGFVRLHRRTGDGRDVLSPGRRAISLVELCSWSRTWLLAHRSWSTTRFCPTLRLPNSATRCRPPVGASDTWAAACCWL